MNSASNQLVLFLLFIGSFKINAEPDCNNPSYGDIDYCLSKIQGEIDARIAAEQEAANANKAKPGTENK